jgi:16S rRNA (guanine527-N7)-methyltransferase
MGSYPFFDLSTPVSSYESIFQQLEDYFHLLRRWNHTVNLTALPLDELQERTIDRLFIEPLISASFVADRPLTWLDLGSGGGSPAIPLKIVRPAAELTMVESRERKAAFLREVVRSLALPSVNVLTQRVETLPLSLSPSAADLVSVRAVKLSPELIEIVGGLVKPGGRLLLFTAARQASGPVACFRLLSTEVLPDPHSRLTVWERE